MEKLAWLYATLLLKSYDKKILDNSKMIIYWQNIDKNFDENKQDGLLEFQWKNNYVIAPFRTIDNKESIKELTINHCTNWTGEMTDTNTNIRILT